jgi:hypothetical protein
MCDVRAGVVAANRKRVKQVRGCSMVWTMYVDMAAATVRTVQCTIKDAGCIRGLRSPSNVF